MKDTHELNNKARLLDLEVKLFGMDMHEGHSMHEHITKGKLMRDKLVAVCQRTSSIIMVMLLLERLPRNYGGFMTTMTAGHKAAPITFKELVPFLLQQEAREKKYGGTNEKP